MLVETLNERAARQARQLASRKVTQTKRECSCISCVSGPRRPHRLLVERFAYASEPHFEYAQWSK